MGPDRTNDAQIEVLVLTHVKYHQEDPIGLHRNIVARNDRIAGEGRNRIRGEQGSFGAASLYRRAGGAGVFEGVNHSIPFLSQCRGTLAPALHNRESLQPSVEADGQLAQGGIKRRTELSEPPGMPYHSAVPLALELGMATLIGSAYPSITVPMLPTKRWHRHRSLDYAASSDPEAVIGFHSYRKRYTKRTNEETAAGVQRLRRERA